MNEIDKEVTRFILQAIEKLSIAILTNDYEPEELNEIHQEAGMHLNEL